MESVLSIMFSAENIRMLVLLVFGFCGYVLINSRMIRLEYTLSKKIDGVESSLNKRIDGVEKRIDDVERRIDGVEASLNRRIDGVEYSIKELKHNDFAHLNNTIEALTYALEKNGSLKPEDKEYVDSRLDR